MTVISTSRTGTNQPKRILRKSEVYSLAVRGLTATDIATQLECSKRTVERDFQKVKAELLVEAEAKKLRTLTTAMAELDELWREGWKIYQEEPRVVAITKKGQKILEDPTYRRLTAIERLTKISQVKNRITGLLPASQLTQIVDVKALSFNGVKIVNAATVEDLVREGGIEYAAKYGATPGSSD